MCNTNISIIFRVNKHKLLNFYMKPCWQKVFIRSKKFKNQLTFFNTVNHMTNSSLSNPCIDTPLNSSKFNIYIHLKIKLFNPKNEHKKKSWLKFLFVLKNISCTAVACVIYQTLVSGYQYLLWFYQTSVKFTVLSQELEIFTENW